jgi:Skp family chaperone for outer membrane proteins
MKTIRLIAVSALFAAIFSLSAFAQGTAQPAGSGKVGVIYSGAFFDDKVGITRISVASKTLQTEFASKRNELQTLVTRLQNLEKEIKTLQDQSKGGTVPIDTNAAQAKVEEFERLQREGKFKQEELTKAVEAREAQLIAPIFQDIGKTLQEFAKGKGFSMLVDGSKDQAQMLVYVADTVDITDEFIKLFNARPATTATATPARPAPAKP